MALERPEHIATFHVPQADRQVVARGRQGLPVRGEGDAAHPGPVGLELFDFLPGRPVPQADDRVLVARAGRGELPIRRERGAEDPIPGLAEPTDFLPGREVPEANRVVLTLRPLAVFSIPTTPT